MSEVFSQNPFNHSSVQRARIRRIFDRRAAHFNEANQAVLLPREIARRMHERLNYIKIKPARVLDAGCGAGADLPLLAARFAKAAVTGLDLSYRMSAQARGNAPGASAPWSRLFNALCRTFGARAQSVVQADFAMPPFEAQTFDLVWSNLALHWHAQPDTVFAEWRRVLKSGGLLMFSTLGPDSLRELHAAWRTADADIPQPRVLSFIDMHDLGDCLARGGFEIPVMDIDRVTLTYRSPAALLNDVRRWGAYPFERSRLGLMGRRQHAALIAALEAQRSPDGQIGLTFEVIYGHAWKTDTQASQTTSEGHKTVRVEDIRKRTKKRLETIG